MFFPYISVTIFGCLLFLGVANIAQSSSQEASSQASPEKEASLVTTQIKLISPTGFSRIDNVGRDISEILVLCRPEGVQEMAIFADSEAWKKFYAEIYGNNPFDLGLYADLTVGSDSSSHPLDLRRIRKYFPSLLVINSVDKPIDDSDMSSQFIVAGQTAATPFELLESGPGYLTFKTTLGQMEQKGNGELIFKDHYHMISSVIEVNGELLCLNLYYTKKGSTTENALELALTWRDEYLEQTAHLLAPVAQSDTAAKAFPTPTAIPLSRLSQDSQDVLSTTAATITKTNKNIPPEVLSPKKGTDFIQQQLPETDDMFNRAITNKQPASLMVPPPPKKSE